MTDHDPIEHILSRPWHVVPAHTEVGLWRTEDMSIFTDTDEEVVGCFEDMRAYREVFDYIVQLHNKQLIEKSAFPDVGVLP